MKLSRIILSVCIGLILSACATQSHLAAIDQQAWTEYTCSGIKNWHDCKQAARAACPQGFYIRNELENITIQRRVFEAACKT